MLFLHPIDNYDVLIRLRPEALCRMHQSLLALEFADGTESRRKYANIPSSSEQDDVELRVDFDPALQFYVDLKVRHHRISFVHALTWSDLDWAIHTEDLRGHARVLF